MVPELSRVKLETVFVYTTLAILFVLFFLRAKNAKLRKWHPDTSRRITPKSHALAVLASKQGTFRRPLIATETTELGKICHLT